MITNLLSPSNYATLNELQKTTNHPNVKAMSNGQVQLETCKIDGQFGLTKHSRKFGSKQAQQTLYVIDYSYKCIIVIAFKWGPIYKLLLSMVNLNSIPVSASGH